MWSDCLGWSKAQWLTPSFPLPLLPAQCRPSRHARYETYSRTRHQVHHEEFVPRCWVHAGIGLREGSGRNRSGRHVVQFELRKYVALNAVTLR